LISLTQRALNPYDQIKALIQSEIKQHTNTVVSSISLSCNNNKAF